MSVQAVPRPAQLWHVPWLLSALWAFTRSTPWLPVRRSAWLDVHLMGKIILRGWVRQLLDARGPVGFIARDGVSIHALYIHPRGQGRGLGRALLSDAKACSDRLELWVLAENSSARAFYAKEGFDEVMCGRGLGNDENLPDILMVWQAEPCPWERRIA